MARPSVIAFNGEVHSQAEWGRLLGLSSRLISKRLAKRWEISKVLATDLPRYPRLKGSESKAWRGGRVVMADRYIGVFMPEHPRANPSGYVREHIVVAERALGRSLPVGVLVHHVDEDRANNANANLVICQDNAYHKLLHVRLRITKAGGSPNTDKICGRCRVVLGRKQFPLSSINSDGLYIFCRGCTKAKNRAYKEAVSK